MHSWIRLALTTALAIGVAPIGAAGQSATSLVQVAQSSSRQGSVVLAPTAARSGEGDQVAKINGWTIGLAGGLPEGTFLRFATEIARNLNEGGELRVLPVVTQGATDNVKDLLYLKGIDIAITNTDALEYFKTIEKIPNIEKRVNYISAMYLSEVHVLARPEIKSLQDLAGKKVGFHEPGAGPSITAPILFRRLGIQVEPVYINNSIALEKMKSGEMAALVNNGGKPINLFANFKNEQGFKFLEIPFEKFDDYYVPAVLTSDDYPAYIKPGERVETLATPALLAVFNWPKGSDRFRRVVKFIDLYFDRFDRFKRPPYHGSWKTINLASQVPGWTRYWVVDDKLKEAAAKSTKETAAKQGLDVQLARQQAARAAPGNAAEQERLFQQFLEWSKTQSSR